jgi:hypothetical protein
MRGHTRKRVRLADKIRNPVATSGRHRRNFGASGENRVGAMSA